MTRMKSTRWPLCAGALLLLLVTARQAHSQPALADLLDQEDAVAGQRPSAAEAAPRPAAEKESSGNPAVPPAPAVKESRAKVEEVFGKDLRGAKTASAKTAVATQLLEHASDTPESADRYAMMVVAMETAVAAGDIGTLMKVVDGIAANYDMPRAKVEAECLQAFVTNAPVAALGDASEAICSFAKQCLAAGQVDAAKQWATLAINAARRAKDRDQQKAAVDMLNEVRAREKAADAVKPLVDRLAADPNDREAASELGRIRCFREGNWEAGLPLLAKGADADLAAIAKLELVPDATAAARVKLGDAWWAYAEKQKGDGAVAAETRGREHYAIALNDLSGLDKVRIEKRLGEAAAARSGTEKRPKSLVLWFDASASGVLRGPNGQPFDRAKAAQMPVGAWSDPGAGVTCSVGPGAQPPVVDAKAFNGLPGVVFSGTQWLVGGFKTPRTGTVALVCRFEDMGTFMRVFGCMEDDPGIRVSNRTDGALWFELATDFKGGDVAIAPPGSIQGGQQLVITGTWPNPVGVRLNGRPFVAAKPGAADASRGNAMVLGAMTEKGTYPFRGVIAELRVYDEVLPPARLTALEAELNAKWSGARR
jgi:hypothetical protein